MIRPFGLNQSIVKKTLKFEDTLSLHEWTSPILSGNSLHIQQQAIHRWKKCTKNSTVLTNSKWFSLQLIGIWPKTNPIWPSSQLCLLFGAPRSQRAGSSVKIHSALFVCASVYLSVYTLPLFAHIVHTVEMLTRMYYCRRRRRMARSVKIHFADGSHVPGCPSAPTNTYLQMFRAMLHDHQRRNMKVFFLSAIIFPTDGRLVTVCYFSFSFLKTIVRSQRDDEFQRKYPNDQNVAIQSVFLKGVV